MADFNAGEAGKGALGGAATGAAIGSVVPGVGTAIGAGVGAIGGGLLGGLFGGNEESEQQKQARKRMEDYYNSIGAGRTAPQTQYSGFRRNQSDLISRLQAQSMGQGPSLAMAQLKAAQDRNAAQQQSLAASGRGGPLAAQVAANNIGRLGAQSAQDSAAARIAEQQMALTQLGSAVQGARGQDEQANIANADMKLRMMGLDDATRLQLLAQMSGNANAIANKPTLGDQLLAGGSNAFGAYLGAKGAGGGGGGAASAPYSTPTYSGQGGYSGVFRSAFGG